VALTLNSAAAFSIASSGASTVPSRTAFGGDPANAPDHGLRRFGASLQRGKYRQELCRCNRPTAG
jgi:hypothetical protein